MVSARNLQSLSIANSEKQMDETVLDSLNSACDGNWQTPGKACIMSPKAKFYSL